MSGSKSKGNSHFKRRRRRGSYLGVTGKYPSPQSDHSLFFESFRERDLFVLLAFQPGVEVIEDHPFTIEYSLGNTRRRYTPDALVRYRADQRRGKGEVFEVKVSWELEKDPEVYAAPFAAAAAHCKTLDLGFRVLTEQDLPRPRVRNLRFLLPYRSYPEDARTAASIRQTLKVPMTLRDLCAAVVHEGVATEDAIAQVWRLVAHQQVAVGLDTPLSMDSLLEAKPWAMRV